MAYRLSEVIDKLADTVDLLELTERLGIPTKKAGRTVLAQCQFHDDTNPSMVLYNGAGDGRQHYHCFSCNTTADLFRLTSARKGFSFTEAVQWLAKTYAVPMPAGKVSKSKQPTTPSNEKKVNSDFFEIAFDIYQKCNNKVGLREWLANRDFDADNPFLTDLLYIKRNTLTNFLTNSPDGYAVNREKLGNLEDVQLVIADHTKYSANVSADTFLNFDKQYRDFFFDDRVLIPLRGVTGKIEGFAGRKISADDKFAKYLYTRGLVKTALLYGSHIAFPLIKRQAGLKDQYVSLYVTEGLMDALRLLSLGLPAVSLLGASLSERQCDQILDLADGLPKGCSLVLYVFLDKDKAGLKGAAAMMKTFLEKDSSFSINLKFVWPIASLSGESILGKDPDDFLKFVSSTEDAIEQIDSWAHPPAVAILSEEIGILPDDILDDEQWILISLSRRFQAVASALKIVDGLCERLLPQNMGKPTAKIWESDFVKYADLQGQVEKNSTLARLATINDDDARLNLARELAESGIRRGELPSDVAAWNRLDISATAFYMGIKARLQQKKFSPMEPFDAVFVSRGFGKTEPRIKSIACPEELVAQQYLVNELLTQRFDSAGSRRFSNWVPAVRYERRKNKTWTTGYGSDETTETLSFAYQIDMDVLEGRQPARESGIFRPYFDCWKDFISSVTRQSAQMNEVFMVRLDVRRYYDELRRTVVRDALRYPIDKAFETLSNPGDFAPWFRPFENDVERQQAVLDWLLDQSFGYSYYDPGTGKATPSNYDDKGIPQGPILSAWLATVALFPLDKALGAQLRMFNSEGRIRAGYARYVDDIILLADSEEVLGALRAAAQDSAQLLQVELVAKETVDPMSPDDFARQLTEGRALAVSGPIGEINLLPAGDGDLGWHSLAAAPPKRYAALQLLRDQTLYLCPQDRLLDQVSTALHADELRPSELAKASRWLWYWAASDANAATVNEIVSRYWYAWKSVCAGASWTLDPKVNAWDDPAFYALEGIEKLLESAHWGEDSLSLEANQRRLGITARLATIARTSEFIRVLSEPQHGDAPDGWGSGTSSLSRMFWQRALGMRWKAAKLMPAADLVDSNLVALRLEHLSSQTRVSLRRALITDAETSNVSVTALAQRGQADVVPNVVRDAILWLHEAFVRLGVELSDGDLKDPLIEICNELNEFLQRADAVNEGSRTKEFIALLLGLCPGSEDSLAKAVGTEWAIVHPMALAAFVAICPRKKVIKLLTNRAHLLPKDDSLKQRVVLPSLPGLPTNGLFAIALADSQQETLGRQIEKIQWFTVKRGENDVDQDDPAPQVSIVASSAANIPGALPLAWTQTRHKHLEVATADWNAAWPRNILISSALPKTGPHQLKWAADVFEALARANHQLQEASNFELEYVPAWTNFVVNRWPDDKEDQPLFTTLISAPVPSEKISGVAFIRNGLRGLKSYDIQKADGHFWRAGVMLTELLGFAEELDKYSALEVPQGEINETTSPERHLLRSVLRKMRGHYSRSESMPRRKDKPHMAASLERSLHLLRNYPTEDAGYEGVAYVLAAEMETRAMGFRLGTDNDCGRPGALTDFLERVARDVCGRIPLGWASQLPCPETIDQIEPRRATSNAWWNLAQRFQGMGNLEDFGWRGLLLGIRVALIGDWLRSLVLELSGAPSQQWAIPETAFVDEVWGIESPVFCNDEEQADYQRLVFRFNTAVSEGRPLHSLDFVTPFGWLTLAAGRLGILNEDKHSPFIIWNTDELTGFKRLADVLAYTRSLSLEEEGAENCNWPFEYIPIHDEEEQKAAFSNFVVMLAKVDERCGLKIGNYKGAWRYDPKSKQFTDTSGETWVFPPWRISITDGFVPEEVASNDRILRAWSETRADNGRLLGVAARGKRISNLLGSADRMGAATAIPVAPFQANADANEKTDEVGLPQAAMDERVKYLIDEAALPPVVVSEGVVQATEEIAPAPATVSNDIAQVIEDVALPPAAENDKVVQLIEEIALPPAGVGESVVQSINEAAPPPAAVSDEVAQLAEEIAPQPTVESDDVTQSFEEVATPPASVIDEVVQPAEENASHSITGGNDVVQLIEEIAPPTVVDEDAAQTIGEIARPLAPVIDDVAQSSEEVVVLSGVQPEDVVQPSQEFSPPPASTGEDVREITSANQNRSEDKKKPIHYEIPKHDNAKGARDRLRNLQADAWARRQEKNDAHVRVALMQWNVADSYRHPLYDIEAPNSVPTDAFSNGMDEVRSKAIKSAHSQKDVWLGVAQIPSWAEFRRRRLLAETLRACMRLKVDLLVLPEYSVRPDTVKWLRDYLVEREINLSILAGTYRLYGNTSDPGYNELHKDILGLEDIAKFIPLDPEVAKTSASRFYGERSALITLLSPIKYDGKWVVSAFSRAKKYPSNAAEEVINPRQDEWEPLFSIGKLLDEISERDEVGERNRMKRDVSAANMIPLLSQGRHMHYFAELICSELFLPMSPINYSGLASEYQKLVIRFGGVKTILQAENEVLADVKVLASYLGPSPRPGNLYRRTILLVPAMSGRSADYWCFGQSAILAGGVTTVFCNAVAGKQGVGGSCFIGRKSWEFSQDMLGMQSHVTPYSGWSRGIFYNSKADALGETEQAVVIADIDPTNMNEGRPRQQALPIPLQLVAYLPIAETTIKDGVPIHPSKVVGLDAEQVLEIEKKQFEALSETLNILDAQSMAGKIIDPAKHKLSKLGAEFSGFLNESEKPFLKRLEHWNKHWRDQPYAGLPPALIDWLWADMTPNENEKLPLLFVPSWTMESREVE